MRERACMAWVRERILVAMCFSNNLESKGVIVWLYYHTGHGGGECPSVALIPASRLGGEGTRRRI
jgi:hypothetical protein